MKTPPLWRPMDHGWIVGRCFFEEAMAMKRFILSILALVWGLHAEAAPERLQDPAVGASQNVTTRLRHYRYARTGYEILIVGGAGLSRVSSDNDQAMETRNRDVYSAAVLFEAGRKLFSVQTGLMYFAEGYSGIRSSVLAGGVETNRFDMGINYVGIPVMGRLNLARWGRNRIALSAGVIEAYAIDADTKSEKITNSAGQAPTTQSFESSGVDSVRRNNLFAAAGVGGDLAVSPQQDLRLEAVYRRSVLPIGAGDDSGIFSNSLLLNVGFAFDI